MQTSNTSTSDTSTELALRTLEIAALKLENDALKAELAALASGNVNRAGDTVVRTVTADARFNPTSESSEHESIAKRLADHWRTPPCMTVGAQNILQIRERPSDMASKPGVVSKYVCKDAWESEVPVFNASRPSFQTHPSLPPDLMCSVFGDMLDQLAAADVATGLFSSPETPDRLELALDLCMAMSEFYPTEGERQAAFFSVMEDFFKARLGDSSAKIVVMQKIGIEHDKSKEGRQGKGPEVDGVICLSLGGFMFPLLFIELKNELAECLYQGMRYFQLALENPKHFGSRLAVGDACPCLLLQISGPTMRICALASQRTVGGLQQVTAESLTPFIDLLPAPHRPHRMTHVAAVLCILHSGLTSLAGRYAHPYGAHLQFANSAVLAPTPPRTAALEAPQARFWPYPLHDAPFVPGAGVLCPIPGRAVYVATLEGQSSADGHLTGPERVLVKYSSSTTGLAFLQHGQAVQKLWAESGLAPGVISTTRLPGGHVQIVQELLEPPEWVPAFTYDTRLTPTMHKAITGALARAHTLCLTNGFRTVHGDCRLGNILLRRAPPMDSSGAEAWEVKFVDFDWAGAVGEARYPPYMNREIAWPEGVTPLGVITQEHDAQLLAKSLAVVLPVGTV